MKKSLLLIFSFCAAILHSQQWTVTQPYYDGAVLIGGDCNSDGNYIVGACNDKGFGYRDAYVLYVDNNGNYVRKTLSFDGYKAHLCSAICLDDGNAFVVGVKGGTITDHHYDTLWISIMTPQLEIVEEHNYPIIEPFITWTTDVYMEFNNYGEIVVLADVSKKGYPWMTNGVYVVLKCDVHGNIKKSKYFADGHGLNGARPTGIIKVPDSDMMMLLGKGFFVTNCHSVCYIDNDLEIVDVYPLPWMEDVWNYTDCWKDNGHFLMSSVTHHNGVSNNPYYAAVFEVDDRGRYVDTLIYDRADTSDYTAQFGSMAYVSDDEIYIATYWENGSDELPSDAVVCLIDNDLNLKGTKRLKDDKIKIRIMHCCKTSDDGCLVYGQGYIWKLIPEDFVIPWSLSDNTEASLHIQVYPNPTCDYLDVLLNNDDNQDIEVSISDVAGRKFFKQRFEQKRGLLKLDVSLLRNGIYFYEIIANRHCIKKEKFIKY